MDWALARKDGIETALAARIWPTAPWCSTTCPRRRLRATPARWGRSGTPRRGQRPLQIVYGLLCSPKGAPWPSRCSREHRRPENPESSNRQAQNRFGLSNIALVGDRGMLTSARIRDELRLHSWIGSARCARPDQGPGQRRGAAAVAVRRAEPLRDHPPRLPARAAGVLPQPGPGRRTRPKRAELLAATETQLQTIATATRRARRPLRGQDKIACGWARCATSSKWPNTLTSDHRGGLHPSPATKTASPPRPPSWHLRAAHQPAEQALQRDEVVLRYKDLADVERFFRTLNSELDVRPIRHRLADRVRAHMFLRMLSYDISWHMKPPSHQSCSATMTNPPRPPNAPTRRARPTLRSSPHQGSAQTHRRRSPGEQLHQPAHRPGHLCANDIQPTNDLPAFTKLTRPTPLQQRAFDLLAVAHRHGLT